MGGLCNRRRAYRAPARKHWERVARPQIWGGARSRQRHDSCCELLGRPLAIVAEEGERAGLARIRRELVRPKAPYGNGIPW